MSLARRCVAELLGTAFLVAAVVGSGIAASRLSPGDVGLQLLENSAVTGAVLVALILALQPVSAAFNPVVTLVERGWGIVDTRETVALIVTQVVGGGVGAVLANLMFDLDAVSVATTHRASPGHLLGEVVATFGLVLVIFGSIRSGRTDAVAWAVGGYIAAAYWFTSSTSFANPAVTLARTLSDTFAGIAPASAPAFVLAQLVGGALAAVTVGWLFQPAHHPLPRTRRSAMPEPPTVLFVCVHNAGRSQMAAALLAHHARGRVQVLSAGTEPADRVNPAVVEVMAELGLDVARETPTLLADTDVDRSDVVVTMGCGDECPWYPGTRYEDWPLDDPAGRPVDEVRVIRDEIDGRVRALVTELLGSG